MIYAHRKALGTNCRMWLLVTLGMLVSSCEPQVYGSGGVSSSSLGGYNSASSMHGIISIGGRIR